MKINSASLIDKIGLSTPLIGFYDTPDISPFEPLIEPRSNKRLCIFAFYKQWLRGKTLHITSDNFGCRGARYWLFGKLGRTRDNFIKFLIDDEGLKASYDLMNKWLDQLKPYTTEYTHILIGPLREDQYSHLKTVTFFVHPDQLSALIIGAQYDNNPNDPPAVIVPFGSGCMELITSFQDLNVPQAVIGTTDIAMRQYIPIDILAFTVTKPMFEKLCNLDTSSFLYKPFWERLIKSRKNKHTDSVRSA